ncbi:hypothetical protein [Streptomyces sp. NPDC058664]|uniref:hypothetical protein n=1 Tax=unclassified Streptomyces TaxID=2593676 RepID=UPI00364D7816
MPTEDQGDTDRVRFVTGARRRLGRAFADATPPPGDHAVAARISRLPEVPAAAYPTRVLPLGMLM